MFWYQELVPSYAAPCFCLLVCNAPDPNALQVGGGLTPWRFFRLSPAWPPQVKAWPELPSLAPEGGTGFPFPGEVLQLLSGRFMLWSVSPKNKATVTGFTAPESPFVSLPCSHQLCPVTASYAHVASPYVPTPEINTCDSCFAARGAIAQQEKADPFCQHLITSSFRHTSHHLSFLCTAVHVPNRRHFSLLLLPWKHY